MMTWIVAIDDATGLIVFEDPKQVRVYCEGIDFENGVYEFWNDRAQRLKPKFVEPVRRRRWWIFETVTQGTFDLEPVGDADPDGFHRFLGRATYLDDQPASRFRTLEEARDHLTRRLSRLRD